MSIKLRRSMFIGLGGTGMKTILRTKAALLDNYGQNGELPPFFSFLGIDTDNGEYDKTVASKDSDRLGLDESEKFSISVADPYLYYEDNKKDMKWMPHQNVGAITTLDTGAGQVRSNGRLAFMFNLELLKERLRKAIVDTCNAEGYTEKWKNYEALESGIQGRTKIEVHVVFSLCGGTGSGTFLDVAYMLRELARETGYIMTLNGYAVMPGVFIEQIKDPTEKSRVRPNAYGALRELDYLMSMVADERKVKISWQKKETDQTPFDSLVLVDNRNTMGIAYNEMENLTEMLSLALLATTGQIGTDTKSVGDNVKIDMRMKAFDVDKKSAWVAAVGTSTIIFDGKHVAKVYELKAQNKLLHDLQVCSEDKNTIANTWIDTAKIRENDGQDQVIEALFDIHSIGALGLTADGITRQTAQADAQNKLDFYYKNTVPSPNEWQTKVDALYKDVCEKLVKKEQELSGESIRLQLEFLKEVRNSIREIFRPMMVQEQEEESKKRDEAKSELDLRINKLGEYMKQMIRTKTASYVNAVNQAGQIYVLEELEVKRRTYASQFYSQLESFLDTEIHNASEIIRKLEAIEEENAAAIRALQNRVRGGKTVVIDMADSLIQTVVVEENDKVLISGLIEQLPNKTLYGDISKDALQKALHVYAASLPRCEEYRNRTIDDVINAMSKEEFEDVVCRAANYSQPFLTIDGHSKKLKNGSPVGLQEIYYICVPDKSTCRLTKENLYRSLLKAEMATPISTGLTDRIIIYRQKRPIPAFAVGGLTVLQDPYDAEQEFFSFHIDEQLQKRMDDENYGFKPLRVNQDENIQAWIMGCILEFVKFEKGFYWFQDFTSESISNSKENWINTQTAFREEAFDLFNENEELIKIYRDKFRAHVDEIGKKALAELKQDVKDHYFDKYSRCQVTVKVLESKKEYKETLQLIKKENELRMSIFD